MYDIRNMNIWKQEENSKRKRTGIRDIDISELNLSARSFNCLKRANCSTVGDILDRMDEEGNGLRSIRHLGNRSENEIKEMLENIRREYQNRPIPARQSRIKIVRPAKKMMNRQIDEFHLSPASERKLKSSGIFCIQDLYADDMTHEPGWFAVRELFDQISQQL